MTKLVTVNKEGNSITTSLIVAEVFGKRHDSVLRDIKELTCSDEFSIHNFVETSYVHPQNGQTYPMYEMTKDGFSFLVMGYTGAKASKFKEDFITEFNKREMMLKSEDYILDRAMSIMRGRILILEEQIEKDSLKVEYFDTVLQSESSLTTTQIAKGLGVSATKLNQWLKDKDIQYKSNGQWVLRAKYQDKGYTKSRTTPITLADGSIGSRSYTVWTEEGRLFIYSLFPQSLKLSI